MSCTVAINRKSALILPNLAMESFRSQLANNVIKNGFGSNKPLVKILSDLDQGLWGQGMCYTDIADLAEKPSDIKLLIELLSSTLVPLRDNGFREETMNALLAFFDSLKDYYNSLV